MSTALAIAGVSAVMRDLLNDGLIKHDVSDSLGSVVVSVLPPDRVVSGGVPETSQLNLFLYHVTPNLGWRNEGLPSRDSSGRHRLALPPLALNLHYLLSAYGAEDLHGEILLGYAMQLLHETPVISREAIRDALDSSPSLGNDVPQHPSALADSALADQVEQLRITPEYLSTEDMSKLWTATQAHYRPTAAYQVSVVLIESTEPRKASLPVLTRGGREPVNGRERGVGVEPSLIPPVPTIEAVNPPGSQPVAQVGEPDPIDLVGHHLDGSLRKARLINERLAVDELLDAKDPEDPKDAATRLQFVVSTDRTADFPVGVYQVSAQVVRPSETEPRSTNRLALVIAPRIAKLPGTVARDGDTASFSVEFTPMLRHNQNASLLLGQSEYLPETPEEEDYPVDSLDFVIPKAPEGTHLARLRIDGIDSPIIDRTVSPPEFLDQRIQIT